MSAQAEEDERLEQLIAAADWCEACGVPVGCGDCPGCIAVAASTLEGSIE